jgi:multiple sugar transport system permease protein
LDRSARAGGSRARLEQLRRGVRSRLGEIGRAVLNTAVESLGATLVIAVVGALRLRAAALPSARRALLRGPGHAHAAGLRDAHPVYKILTQLGLVNTYLGIILVYTSGFLPLAMWIMYSMFQALPPSIEEAAAIDGASTAQIFRRIVLPIVRPGMAATAIIIFLFGWGQFIFPLVLGSTNTTQPLTVTLSSLSGRHVVPYTIINAAAIVAIAIPALIVFFLNRWILDGIVAGSVK